METPYSKDELEKLKDYAKILYTRDRLTQEEVSEKTGLHHNTINKWSVEGGWKKLRRNFVATREEQMARMLDELIELNDKIGERPKGSRYADAKESAIRHRLVSDIKYLETNAALSEVLNTARGLLNFIRKIDLAKAQELSRWIDQYIKSLLADGIESVSKSIANAMTSE